MGIKYVGTTKWFSSKGEAYGYLFGFNHEDGTPGEIFVHYKALLEAGQENPKYRLLKKGDKVSFEIGPGHGVAKSGTQALNVSLVKE